MDSDYAANFSCSVASMSRRGGLHDWLTLEAEGQVAPKFVNAGPGAVVDVASRGILSVAGSASRFGEAFGFQAYAGLETQIDPASFQASTQRTFVRTTTLHP